MLNQELQIDVRLLDRVRGGDPAGISELYDRHNRLLFGLAVRILQDPGEAEEVVQDVFVHAWTRVETFDGSRGTPAGWLVGITRNRAIDRLRRRASRARNSAGVPDPVPVRTPEALAAAGEQNRHVHDALVTLPLEQRELIERAYFVGSTQSEMARDFNLPLGTVKTRVRAALKALRELLPKAGAGATGNERATGIER